ncbi:MULTISPECIES: hypothetical protein [Planomicrobium]|uniref:Uncharacterized protein n=1 Tax=Planomicrobium okeanokoites TaxID=244 RepID=A0ABV7KPK2_PLAOK|nr:MULTISPECIES: hypothetical protein [Planomicrobium]PKH09941.1 hypothetical protein CXF70_12075 [Planomicrobium sp. MB-3u-38]TAA71330.1 hypothetical protein D2910_03370 [Planomicrobium okeanokoites]
MKNFQIDFYFDQGNTLTHTVKATSKDSALSGIPTNGTYEFRDDNDKNVYRITINMVKYIIVSEL